MKFKISDKLSLPRECITWVNSFISKRGAGKTYCASVLAEEMLKNKVPIIVIDAMGIFWGLRVGKDGKGDGLPIVVFGGEHADIPLDPLKSKQIAKAIVETNISAVLDLSDLSKAQTRRIVAEFLDELYKINRVERHVFIEESDIFAPQRTFGIEQEQCLSAMDNFVRRGGNHNLGCSLITQRSAVLNKNLLSVAPWMRVPIHNSGLGISLRTLEQLWKQTTSPRGGKSKKINHIKMSSGEICEEVSLKKSIIKTLCYKSGMGWWAPIKKIIRHRYKGNLLRLSQKWGEIVVTPNHSVYSTDNELVLPQSNPELLALRHINQQHTRDDETIRLSLPNNSKFAKSDMFTNRRQHFNEKHSEMKYKLKEEELKAFLRFLGAWLSEGSAHHPKDSPNSYVIQITNTDKKWLESLYIDSKKFCTAKGVIYKSSTEGVWNLTIRSKPLGMWLKEFCGHKCDSKRFPDFVFGLSIRFADELIASMVKGDGYRYKNGRWSYFTKSSELAQGLGLLLSLHEKQYTVGKDEKTGVYRLLYCNWYNHKDRTIKLIKKIPYDGYVYDLEIGERYPPNFVVGVGNVVVHNTQSDCLIILRTLAPQDKKAIQAWVDEQTDEEKTKLKIWYDSLKTLKNGESWIWKPEDPKIFKKIMFRKRETFHATRLFLLSRKSETIKLMEVGEFVRKFKDKFEPKPKETPKITTQAEISKAIKPFTLQKPPQKVLDIYKREKEIARMIKPPAEPVIPEYHEKEESEITVRKTEPMIILQKLKPTLTVMSEPTTPLGKVIVVLANEERADRWSIKKIKERISAHAWDLSGVDEEIKRLMQWEILAWQSNHYIKFYPDRVRVVEVPVELDENA